MGQRFQALRNLFQTLAKRAKRVRTAEEFRIPQLRSSLQAPPTPSAAYAWDLTAIMAARDQQFAGNFAQPARLIESMRTDDALAVAEENRLAPSQMISVDIRPAKPGRGETVAYEAEALFGTDGLATPRAELDSIRLDRLNHGVGIGVLVWTPRATGSRVDVELRHWPIEWVYWDSQKRTLMTRVDTAYDPIGYMPITHGDGRWVVFAKHGDLPWRKQAALLPACMVWARHAFSARDWAKGSASHGNAKVIGELPEGVSLQAKDDDGNVVGTSAEAQEFLDLLVDIASLDAPVGIKPHGSTVEYITNSSRAWEVWRELMANAERSAARIYLGTDGVLGSQGGAPGVDVQALFGVARTRVEGDLANDREAIRTGIIEPWTAVNFGDSTLAPDRIPILPDSDADAAAESYAKRSSAFWADVTQARANGMVVDQAYLERLGERYQIEVPALAMPAVAAPELRAVK